MAMKELLKYSIVLFLRQFYDCPYLCSPYYIYLLCFRNSVYIYFIQTEPSHHFFPEQRFIYDLNNNFGDQLPYQTHSEEHWIFTRFCHMTSTVNTL